ncbi:multicopper oxidase family protein [Okeania sp. SIO1F9]|uniref:multicopper oxidase family protein n=1 Tax=Okeania sp. SIO1F9 TaxID=2607813 RepID=UPI00144D581E|nr:multicopper oxidase domain-containing protein [Okeania sp. SIO1F9]NET76323.1 multicopper oxidase domain-containing protein [Okeania sp. SIO1F9]
MTEQNDEKKASENQESENQESENQEQDILSTPLGRRAFLSGFGLGAGITAASFIVFGATQNKTTLISPYISGSSSTEDFVNGFPQPETIANGTPASPAELRAAQGNINILGVNPRTETTRCFNGQVPGPTFKLQAGERVNIKLVNALPPNNADSPSTGCPGELNRPRCFNSTNLHFHGFHVSPMSIAPNGDVVSGGKNDEVEISSDDVLYELDPSTTGGSTEHPYCVYLPQFHAPGTHWYHPHMHGSTAIQLIDGMAGALIIEDPPADQIDVDQDLLWIIQEIIGNDDEDVYRCVTTSQEFTVNGQSQPTLTMQPQELHRWRFINATSTPRGFITLKFQKKNSDGDYEDVTTGVYRIAVDGISHYGQAPELMSSMELSPANRADFLVQLEEGEYRVFKDTFADVRATTAETLAYINVTGTPVSSPKEIPDTIPGDFPDYLQPFDTPAPDPAKTISFDVAGSGCGGQTPETVIPREFQVNGEVYDPEGPDETVQNVDINTDEVWLLTNTTGAAHPFHIHVNPFQVIEINGQAVNNPIWWDTFYIPRNRNGTDGSIKIRHRFDNYPGKFVFHCHILIHEDLGMMQNVNVKGTGIPPCEPSDTTETFTWNPESPSANA